MKKTFVFNFVVTAWIFVVAPSSVFAVTEEQAAAAMMDYYKALEGDKEAEKKFVDFIKTTDRYTEAEKQERLTAFYQQLSGNNSDEPIPGPTAERQKAEAMKARERGRQRVEAEWNAQRLSSGKDSTPINNYSSPTEEDLGLAREGYELYKQSKFSGQFKGGQYTDPNPTKQGYEFWSDGRKVSFDRDSNGHPETMFMINDGSLEYVGSVGNEGRYVDVGSGFEEYIGKESDEPFRH